ncbi:MAG: hypothetical protein JEZ12_20365 [Desulfobacterium sp.]|nr:hypothetical protein [Desulfobacterium sp.]
MKQLWTIICYVVIVWSSTTNGFCGTVDTTDIGEGFSGIKWGTDIKDLQTFEKAYTKDNVDFYLNPDKAYSLEKGTPVTVLYGFSANKLFAVYIDLETMEIYGKVNRYIRKKYGDFPDKSYSSKTNQVIKKWKYKDVKIKLKLNNESLQMKLAIYYLPLSLQVSEEMQETFPKTRVEFLPTLKTKKKPKQLFPLLSF